MSAGYYGNHEIEVLALHNAGANDPYEPFCGVVSLFNADLHAGEPNWAPRDHWVVDSPYHISHRASEELVELGILDPEDIEPEEPEFSQNLVSYLNTLPEEGGPGDPDPDEMDHIWPRK